MTGCADAFVLGLAVGLCGVLLLLIALLWVGVVVTRRAGKGKQ
jgi:uncharacterized membrane protein SpoIIM required for sporulation